MALDIISYLLSKKYTDDKVAAIEEGFAYKGEKDYQSDLPTTGNENGDIWIVKYKGSSGTDPWGVEFVWSSSQSTWTQRGDNYDDEIAALDAAKVSKTDSPNKIYGTDANGDQTTYEKDSFGQVDDVQYNGVSVVADKVANIQLNIENGEGTGSAHIPVQPGRETFEGLYGATGNDANENYPNPYIAVQNNKFTLDNVEYTVNFSNGQPTTVTSSVASYPVTTVSGEKFATINGVKVEILYNLSSQATSIIRYATWAAGTLGKYTFQWGGTSSAKNDRSAVGGTKNVVGYGALAGGDTNYAANFGFATGYKNYTGLYSLVAGTRNFGMASATFLRGNENRAYAPYADMSGWDNVVTENGTHGRVSGAHNKVNAPYGDAAGSSNIVNGFFGRTYGGNNEANGDYATAGGQNTKADGLNSRTDGSRTHTIKEILKATPSGQPTLGLTVGKRYRFYGTLPSFSGVGYHITCSNIENINTPLTPRTTTETGYGFGCPGTEYSASYVIANGSEYGGIIGESQGEIFSGAFNFIYQSENVSNLSDTQIAELKSHIVEHPAIVLTKGSWYHFDGSLINAPKYIVFSKVANLTTSTTKRYMEYVSSFWGMDTNSALWIGKYMYSEFSGSFDFMYDGNTDIELTGEYAYYSEKITVSPLQTIDHNTYAGGAGTESFGHAARSTGILTKAYGDGAVSEGGNTQAGVLVDLNVYSEDYDETGDTYQTYLVPSVKYTHAGGLGTKATAEAQTVFGKYNKENSSALLIIGNGTADNARHNALEVLTDGSIRVNEQPIGGDTFYKHSIYFYTNYSGIYSIHFDFIDKNSNAISTFADLINRVFPREYFPLVVYDDYAMQGYILTRTSDEIIGGSYHLPVNLSEEDVEALTDVVSEL